MIQTNIYSKQYGCGAEGYGTGSGYSFGKLDGDGYGIGYGGWYGEIQGGGDGFGKGEGGGWGYMNGYGEGKYFIYYIDNSYDNPTEIG